MAISGQKTKSVIDRYNIFSEGDLRDAAAKLAAYLETKPATPPKGPHRESSHTIRTHRQRKRA